MVMNFSPIVEPELSFLSESATNILSVSAVAMSSYARTLLVEVGYIDSGKQRLDFLIYDTASDSFTGKLSDYLGGSDGVSITAVDVAFEATEGITFVIVYKDLTESWQTSTGNRLALVQNGVLLNPDLIEQVSDEVANVGLDRVVLNASGTAVTFSSAANNLTAYSDANDTGDVFRIDIAAQTLQRLSQIADDDEGSEPSNVLGVSVSGGQEYVLFETYSEEFSKKDSNNQNDLYLIAHNSVDAIPVLVTQGTDDQAASVVLGQAIISGGSVLYVSESGLLVDGDANQSQDIFLQNLTSGVRQRLTSTLDATVGNDGRVGYQLLSVSNSLNKLLFSSNLDSLSQDEGLYQIYLMDLGDLSLETLSLTPEGDPGNDSSVLGVMDALGTNYAFQTQATNLVETPGRVLLTHNEPNIQLLTAGTDKGITNITLDLWKNNSVLEKPVDVDNGLLLTNETVDFDAVKLSDNKAFTPDIKIGDAIDILRHIVGIKTLDPTSIQFHAADVDNDGAVKIGDAIDVLRHIVDIKKIDTFDLIDDQGARVTQLDPDATGDAPTWILVPNGDVDLSGSFAEDYVMAVDIV